jgi:single-strand DNA-binding protein
MSAQTAEDSTEGSAAAGPVNEVRLAGRISAGPEERVLPSGDVLWTFRLVVPRPSRSGARPGVDALDCAVWRGRVRRSVASWRAGDVVEVSGAIRRRFFRVAAGGAASRFEVEVEAGRLLSRAASE